MRDDRAAEIDECPHDFEEPTSQCRRCAAHCTTIIERYRNKLLIAYAAADAVAAHIADAERELDELKSARGAPDHATMNDERPISSS